MCIKGEIFIIYFLYVWDIFLFWFVLVVVFLILAELLFIVVIKLLVLFRDFLDGLLRR